MAGTIFYSWQNDLDHKSHRYFIENAIKQALKIVKKEAHVVVDYDRDTKGTVGSPDITTTIFDKIEKSVLFICDVSIINSGSDQRKTPNPNVLIELGYAVHKLGWDRVICLFDSTTGAIDELPFDIRQKRVTPYKPDATGELERLSKILSENIQELYVRGKLFNPLNDYMKGRIDRSILNIAKNLSNLVFNTITMREGLSQVPSFINMDYEEIQNRLSMIHFPAFLVLNTYTRDENNLKDILRELFSSSYFPKEWSYTVLELIDWIREYNYLISSRNAKYPFLTDETNQYDLLSAVSGTYVNPQNPENLFLIMRVTVENGQRIVDTKKGEVLNTTEYPTNKAPTLRTSLSIRPDELVTVCEKIYKFIQICEEWLDITNSEFVLDPDYYEIT